MNGGMNAAGRVGDRVLPVKIVDVFRQGVKPVWRVTLDDGKSITSTANHRHLTTRGWRQTGELTVGDSVCVMGDLEPGRLTRRSVAAGSSNWVREHGYYVAERAHGKAGPFLHGQHALLRANTALLERRCAHCGIDQGRLERAHLDGDPLNQELDNLAYLCGSCHKKHDYANGGRVKMWRKGRAIEARRVVGIEYVGEEMTYDVTVDSEDHSWVAGDGIITHNSHSAAYGVVSYWTAYLKANYPAEYMAALLTSVGDNQDRMPLYLAECRRMGIRVLTPDVNTSQGPFTAVGSDIRFGLEAIKGVGAGVASALLRARAERGEASSFADWLAKTDAAACKAAPVAAMIDAGAFDSLGHPRRGLWSIHADALAGVGRSKKVEATGQAGLFDIVATSPGGAGAVDVTVPASEWSPTERLDRERKVLRLCVSGHPLDGQEALLARHAQHAIAEIVAVKADKVDADNEDGEPVEALLEPDHAFEEGQWVQVAGLVSAFERKVSKRGKSYLQMTVEDRDSAALTVMVFERTLAAMGDRVHQVRQDAVVAVKGRLKGVNDGDPKIFANDIVVLGATDAQPSARVVTLSVPAATMTSELAREIKGLTDLYPGREPLMVRLVNPTAASETTVLIPARVHGSNLAFVRDACALFGPNCLAA
ncbi:helix-hairpin-helix domain-containing protein [Micromonospora fluostatini]